MDMYEAIITRRSIRHYKPDPIDDATLEKVLEAARWAPSWANQQPCRFVIVQDQSIKEQLADMIGKNPATNSIRKAPIVIVACAKLGVSGYYEDKLASDEGDWHMYDVAVAMQNIALAAHAMQLGTVHVGLNFDTKKVAQILAIPEGYKAVVMMPLGYPEREGRFTPRKDLSDVVFKDKFGKS
jgi:nitroreductase